MYVYCLSSRVQIMKYLARKSGKLCKSLSCRKLYTYVLYVVAMYLMYVHTYCLVPQTEAEKLDTDVAEGAVSGSMSMSNR